jgi:hypothetical protein
MYSKIIINNKRIIKKVKLNIKLEEKNYEESTKL